VSWKLVKLGTLVELITKGTTPTSIGYKFTEVGINFVKIESIDLNGNFINNKFAKINEACNEALKRSQLKEGDILFSIAGALGRAAIVSKEILPANTNQAIAIIRLKNSNLISKEFLLRVLASESILSQVGNMKAGVAQQNLSLSQLKEFLIPVPPLQIQQKIVVKLDKIFAEIDKATAASESKSANANLLVKGTITTLIRKFSKDCFVKFGDICNFVRGPFGGSLKKSIFIEKGYAVYEQQHPINNQFDSFRYFITDKKFNEMKRFEVLPYDLLMSCSGTLGKIAIVPKDAPKGIINQALLKITPKKIIRKDYLKIIMDSDYFQSILWNVSGGTAQLNVPSVKVIKNFLIPLPTIEEQDEFIKIVSSIHSYDLSNIHKEKKKLLVILKQSILKKAFNDELVKAA
jgi:type I restriction enzyme S subunit